MNDASKRGGNRGANRDDADGASRNRDGVRSMGVRRDVWRNRARYVVVIVANRGGRQVMPYNRFDLLAGMTLIGGSVVLIVVLCAALLAALWLIFRTM